MSFTLAIVGRPNVGKSTLFNRLVGKRIALVDNQPGVTRDIREGEARLGDLRFTAIDTAGLEEASDESLQGRMRKLTERAVEMADICLFIIDARVGVTSQDRVFAEILRKRADRVLLAANKAEGKVGEAGALEAYALGLGEPIRLSAEHGEGFEDLYSILMPIADTYAEMEREADRLVAEAAPVVEIETGEDGEEVHDPKRPLQIAVMGRPNAGKSTLVNTLLGEERLLTGPEAGITRDAIGLSFEWHDRKVRVFDTAGLRKKARIQAKLEKLSASDALRAVRYAEVVVLLLDARNSFEQQDLRLADLAHREGRAIVIAVNKWDLIADKQAKLRELREQLYRLLPQIYGVPLVTLSALTGRGLDRLYDAIAKAEKIWNLRISTARLNRWLLAKTEQHPPPAVSGRRLRLRYMTQAKSRPPTFIVFCSRAEDLPTSYTRFLVNGLRAQFGLDGVPIRLLIRKSDNPYAKNK